MKPFLQGKKASESVPLRTSHNPVVPGGPTRPGGNGPNVEVIKQGDKVTRLVVTCSCGERIEIDCLYPVGS